MNTVSARIARLCLINRVNYIFDSQTLLNIINALVCSKLYYNCSSIWSNTSNKNILKLQSVQNFAARIVSCGRKNDLHYALAQRCYLSFLATNTSYQSRDMSLLPANARSSIEESICGSHCCAAIRTTKHSLALKGI